MDLYVCLSQLAVQILSNKNIMKRARINIYVKKQLMNENIIWSLSVCFFVFFSWISCYVYHLWFSKLGVSIDYMKKLLTAKNYFLKISWCHFLVIANVGFCHSDFLKNYDYTPTFRSSVLGLTLNIYFLLIG